MGMIILLRKKRVRIICIIYREKILKILKKNSLWCTLTYFCFYLR